MDSAEAAEDVPFGGVKVKSHFKKDAQEMVNVVAAGIGLQVHQACQLKV